MIYFSYVLYTMFFGGLFVIIYMVFDKKNSRKIQIIDCVIVAILILFAGFRENVGSDYQAYVSIYNFYSQSKEMANLKLEKLFYIAPFYLKELYDDPKVIFWFSAVLIYPLLILYLRKNTIKPSIAFSFYIMGGFWASSLNILRQTIAMIFMLWAYYFFYKRKYIFFALLVMIATGFHVSSIIIAFLIIVGKYINPDKKNLIIIIFFSIAFSFIGKSIIEIVCQKILFLNNYSQYLMFKTTSMDNLRRVCVCGFCFFSLILSVILIHNKNDIMKANDNKENIVLPMLAVPISMMGISFPYINRVNLFLLLVVMESIPIIWNKEYKRNKKSEVHLFYFIIMIIWFVFISLFALDNLSWTYTFSK